jgi:Universal stress protein family
VTSLRRLITYVITGQTVSQRYQVKSLLAPPDVVVTGPGKNTGVHPNTSFDNHFQTPNTSDHEKDIENIRKAQNMEIKFSKITSNPESHRVVRAIVRGDYAEMLDEGDQGLRRCRSYVVATDLSDEAAHALEWTIGTVLRDGDTLHAVYCVSEETGTGQKGEGEGLSIGEGALAMKDLEHVISTSTAKSTQPGANALKKPKDSPSNSPDTRIKSKAEQERYRACEDITQRCIKLLRKTKLQVRVVVEILHCKSPKHLIIEVVSHALFLRAVRCGQISPNLI